MAALICAWNAAERAWLPAFSPTYSYPKTRSEEQRIADSLLAPLDKNRVDTSILYDRVPTIARPDVFEPADTSDYPPFQNDLADAAHGHLRH